MKEGRILVAAIGVLLSGGAHDARGFSPNLGASAYLAWSASDTTTTNLTTPGASNNLYVIFRQEPGNGTGLEFKGGQIDLMWSANETIAPACFEHVGTIFKTSQGTTCTYLNRGSAVPVTTADDFGVFQVAWANSSSLTGCTQGVGLVLQFEFDGCVGSTPAGTFTLSRAALLDVNNIWVDSSNNEMKLRGAHAHVNEGLLHTPPVVAPIAAQSVNEGSNLTVIPWASDADGDPITWSGSSLPSGSNVSASTGTFAWTPSYTQAGSYPAVTLLASDGKDGTGSTSFDITVTNVNRAPVVGAIASQSVAEGSLLAVIPAASDADGDAITWSGSGLPSGASVSAGSGTFTWTPSYSQAGTYLGVTLVASDGNGGTGMASFQITVINTINPPIVSPIPDKAIAEGATLMVSPVASSPEGAILTWSGSGLPTGATVSPSTGTFTWIPSYAQAGTYSGVTLVASDGLGGTGSASFQIIVTNVNRPPVVSAIASQSVAEGSLLTVVPSASDADAEPITWGGSGLPSGSGVSPISGTFTWTPSFTQAGTYAGVTLLASDGSGGAGSTSFDITVINVNRAPVVNALASQTAAEGSLLSVVPSASDADGDPITWSASGLPSGASVSSVTGMFTWTPSHAQAGVYPSVTLVASDGNGGSGSASFQVTVLNINQPPVVDPLADVTIPSGSLLQVLPAATDPDGDILTWTSAGLPAGATINPQTGAISWTPPIMVTATTHVTVTANDGQGGSGSVTFAITVVPPPNSAAAPHIASVHDVPNDQGGHLALLWDASAFDQVDTHVYSLPIRMYRVYRRVAPSVVSSAPAPASFGTPHLRTLHYRDVQGRIVTTYWEQLVEVSAAGLAGYAYIVPTTQDSLAGGNPFTAVFVSALTDIPSIFFDSPVDSGYSVDNLAPAPPQGLIGQYQASSGLKLHWRPGHDADLAQYAVYRSNDPAFPSASTSRTAVQDTSFVDAAWTHASYYRVTAEDIHGNESIPATLGPESIVTVTPGLTRNGYGLRIVSIEGGVVALEVTLAKPGPAVVTIADVRGRTLRTLLSGQHPAGVMRVAWDGRGGSGEAVAGRGVYVVQLSGGGTLLASKVVRVN